jgi:hypothetical protein
MLLLLALGYLAGAGPIDGFYANHAAIKAGVEFRYRAGSIDYGVVSSGGIWRRGDHGLVEDISMRMTGRWESDGQADHTVCRPTAEVLRAMKANRKLGVRLQGSPPFELLSDGEVTAYHILDEPNDMIQVVQGEDPGHLRYGPFHFFLRKFLVELSTNFSKAIPTRGEAVWDGHPCDVEVYRYTKEQLWVQLEVSYDPSIGYLPRFARLISYEPGQKSRGRVAMKEMYLAEAQVCASGGFLPSEWTTITLVIDDFDRKYPNYSYLSILEPGEQRIQSSMYETISFDDKRELDHVRLDHAKGAFGLQCLGGEVPLKGQQKDLTLPRIKGLLGRKLTESRSPQLPNIDAAELSEEYERPGWGGWYALTIIAGIVLAIGIWVYRRRASALAIILPLVVLAQGCGVGSKPIVHLNAAFTRTHLIYRANHQSIPLTIVIRNEGNVPVTSSRTFPPESVIGKPDGSAFTVRTRR